MNDDNSPRAAMVAVLVAFAGLLVMMLIVFAANYREVRHPHVVGEPAGPVAPVAPVAECPPACGEFHAGVSIDWLAWVVKNAKPREPTLCDCCEPSCDCDPCKCWKLPPPEAAPSAPTSEHNPTRTDGSLNPSYAPALTAPPCAGNRCRVFRRRGR